MNIRRYDELIWKLRCRGTFPHDTSNLSTRTFIRKIHAQWCFLSASTLITSMLLYSCSAQKISDFVNDVHLGSGCSQSIHDFLQHDHSPNPDRISLYSLSTAEQKFLKDFFRQDRRPYATFKKKFDDFIDLHPRLRDYLEFLPPQVPNNDPPTAQYLSERLPILVIRHLNLSDLHLERANFVCSVLTNVDFHKTTLSNANFSYAYFQGEKLDFSLANLENADFSKADIHPQTADFISAHLENADFSKTDIHNANFTEAHLNNTSFAKASLKNINFHNAQLQQADFSKANVYGEKLDFSLANLENADFSKADIHPQTADFISAHLENADFSKTDIHNANFTEAHLNNTSFAKASLKNINFHNAQLQHADFSKASLHDTDLSGANLQDATF